MTESFVLVRTTLRALTLRPTQEVHGPVHATKLRLVQRAVRGRSEPAARRVLHGAGRSAGRPHGYCFSPNGRDPFAVLGSQP